MLLQKGDKMSILNNTGKFNFTIKGNLPSKFWTDFTYQLMKKSFTEFAFSYGQTGRESSMGLKYSDKCALNTVKEYIDWCLYSVIQNYGYTDTSSIDEKDFDIENYCKFQYTLHMGESQENYYIIFKRDGR